VVTSEAKFQLCRIKSAFSPGLWHPATRGRNAPVPPGFQWFLGVGELEVPEGLKEVFQVRVRVSRD